jgi:lipopolysaccharide biosynthesis glycosyltransferase
MNIIYCYNDNNDKWVDEQMKYLFTSILSLLENNENVNIYIIYYKFSSKNISRFKNFFSKYMKNINIIKCPEKYYETIKYMQSKSIDTNEAVFLRLLIGDLLPNNLDRVMYIDSDTIINKSILEFYNSPFDGNCLQVILDEKNFRLNKEKELSLIIDSYFNAGVLLINFSKIKDTLLDDSMKIFTNYGHKNFFADQDALNVLYNGKTKISSNYYNYLVQNKFDKNATIYHFAGNGRILRNQYCLIDLGYKTIFWNYFDKTYWKNWRPKYDLAMFSIYLIYLIFPKSFLNLINNLLLKMNIGVK